MIIDFRKSLKSIVWLFSFWNCPWIENRSSLCNEIVPNLCQTLLTQRTRHFRLIVIIRVWVLAIIVVRLTPDVTVIVYRIVVVVWRGTVGIHCIEWTHLQERKKQWNKHTVNKIEIFFSLFAQTKKLWKENLNSVGQQFYQYQQNE